MTKQLKKGLMTVLVFVMACALCFVGMTAYQAKADEPANAEAVAAFNTLVLDVEETTYSSALLLDADWVESIKAVYDSWTKLGNDQKFVSNDSKAIFDSAWAIFSEPYALESYLLGELYFKVNNVDGERLYKTDSNKLDEMDARYNAATADANVKSYIDDVLVNADENLVAAKAEMTRIDNAIITAQDAISNIKYADAAGENLGAKDSTYIRIVLGSEDSIDDAKDALDAIYDVDFATIAATQSNTIGNYSDYTYAVEALGDVKAKPEGVDELIAKLASEYGVSLEPGKEVLWTQKDAIETVEQKYIDLDDSTYNNLKDLVNKISTLNTYTSWLDSIGGTDRDFSVDGKVFDVNQAIANIGTVRYTAASLALIEAAEAAFAGLHNDIKVNDTTTTDYIVAKYPDLVDAREDYNALKAQVDDFKAAVLNMRNVVDVYNEFVKLESSYKALDADQKAAIDADLIPNELKTYIKEYEAWAARANKIYLAAQPVFDLIEAMKAAHPADFAVAYNAAKTAYDALDASTQYAVANRQDLFDTTAELEGAAATWLEKVEAIEAGIADITAANAADKVTINNKDLIEVAVDAFDALSPDMQTIVEAMYADDYDLYDAAANALNDILDEIDDVATAMSNLSTDANLTLDADADSNGKLDIIDFANAVAAAKDAYEDLSADEQAYLQANYAEAFAKYETALVLNEKYSVEAAIAEIGSVTILSGAKIVTAETLMAAYTGTAEVRNKQTLLDARDAFNEITKKLVDWVKNVNDLKGDKEVADLINVNLEIIGAVGTVNTYFDIHDKFTADEKAATVEIAEGNSVAIADVLTLLESIRSQGIAVANELNSDIADFLATHSTITKDDVSDLEAFKNRYNALHSSQQALVTNYADFQVAYSKVNFQTYFGQAVAKLAAEVDSDVFTAEGAIMVNILQSMYAGAGAELQNLVGADYAILTDVATKYAAAADKMDYATLKAIIDDNSDAIADLKAAFEATYTNDQIDTAIDTAIADVLADAKEYADAQVKALADGAVKGNTDAIVAAVERIVKLETALAGLNVPVVDAIATAKAEAIATAKEYADAQVKALKEGIVNDNTEAINAAVVRITALEEGLADLEEDLTSAIATAKSEAIAAAKAYVDSFINGDFSVALARITALEEGLADLDEELTNSIASAKAELKALIKAEEDARIAADKALQEKLDSTRSIAIAALVIACIGLAGVIACGVLLFLKKKAN